MYYRGAAAALVVFDITEAATFHGAQAWIEELLRQGSPDIIIGLAGNKCDLDEHRTVSTSEALNFADEHGCIYFETSAKTGKNIIEIFEEIAHRLPTSQSHAPDNTIDLTGGDETEDAVRQAGCCG
jgi:Ras-related protein Rab-5C